MQREATTGKHSLRSHGSISARAVALSLTALLLLLLAASPAVAGGGAEAAAREAAARYDARVLDVKTEGDRYRVKLLLPSGKVKVVLMPREDASGAGDGERRDDDARTESRRGRSPFGGR